MGQQLPLQAVGRWILVKKDLAALFLWNECEVCHNKLQRLMTLNA